MTLPPKYIIINRAFPVIFHSGFEHVDEANDRRVTSAGFIRRLPNGKFECYGKSESLDIESNPERDSKIINMLFEVE